MSIDSQVSNNGISEPSPKKRFGKSRWHQLTKQITDKLAALSALLFLSPLLLVVSILIKLDSKGPVLFKQARNGLNNREFEIWKFRTMTVMEDGDDFKQAQKNDTRITRIGNFLRKSSIDELPQLVNVLIGDMSIVGPRPHPVALNDKFARLITDYNQRTDMRPGLTGLAQVRGHRGPTDTIEQMQARVDSDIEYIEQWSYWMDLKIIMLTPYYGLISKNAF